MTTPPGDQPPHGDPGEPGDPSRRPEAQGQPWQSAPGGSWQGQQGGPQGSPWQGQQGGPWQQPGYPPYPGPGYGYQMSPPDHPKATTAMIVGIIGLMMCQLASPFAWSMGKRAVKEIDASGGRLGGRGQAQAGYILGVVGTVLLGIGVLFLVVYFIIVIAVIGGSAYTG